MNDRLTELLNDPAVYRGFDAQAGQAGKSTPTAWAALRDRIDVADGKPARPPARPHPVSSVPKARMTASMGALVATVLVAIAVVAFTIIPRTPQSDPSHGMRTFATAAGQRAIVQLANGARAHLGPDTRLAVTSDQANGISITLTGQAQFSVTQNRKRPFLVQTNDAVTRVLGTVFTVRRYATETETHVVVTEGRVAVQGADSLGEQAPHAVLEPGMLGVVSDSGGVTVLPVADARQYAVWTRGELVFNKTPAKRIVTDLSRVYDADISIADSVLARQPITWSVETEQYPLAEALRELVTLLGARVETRGQQLVIVPGRRAPQRQDPRRLPFTQESRYGK